MILLQQGMKLTVSQFLNRQERRDETPAQASHLLLATSDATFSGKRTCKVACLVNLWLGGRMNNTLCFYCLMFLQSSEPAGSVKRQRAACKRSSGASAVRGH